MCYSQVYFIRRNFKYEDVHVEGARTIARIARVMGVKTFLHVSALNASENPSSIFQKGGSRFLKTKVLNFLCETYSMLLCLLEGFFKGWNTRGHNCLLGNVKLPKFTVL